MTAIWNGPSLRPATGRWQCTGRQPGVEENGPALGGITKLAGISDIQLICAAMITAVASPVPVFQGRGPNGSLPSGGCLN